MLFLVTSAVCSVREIRWVALGWLLAAALSSAWALKQFFDKYHAAAEAHQNFYTSYVDSRITGFMGHWMTLSGELMMMLLVIAAIVFFDKDRSGVVWFVAAAVPVAVALGLAWTRSMWLGTLCGGLYLIWCWKKWALAAVPVLIAALLIANPLDIRERALSVLSPHEGQTDSNSHRAELRRIGWEMIKAHPWLGLGPEQVSRQYQDYIRPDMPRPKASEYYGHLENDFLQYAAERGIPTLLALLWMIGWALFDFARALRRLPVGCRRAVGAAGCDFSDLRRDRERLVFLESEQQRSAGNVPGGDGLRIRGYVAGEGAVGGASRRRYKRSV